MEIKTAEFIKGINGSDKILEDKKPQVVFLGRSNVGKSSVINSLTNRKKLVKTSTRPGKTTEINFFLINQSMYFVDLPGYGFAKMPLKNREKIRKTITWYLFRSKIEFKKVVLIVDAVVGLSELDQEVIFLLNKNKCSVVVVANKIDKIKKSKLAKQLAAIKEEIGANEFVPYSAKFKDGRDKLLASLLK